MLSASATRSQRRASASSCRSSSDTPFLPRRQPLSCFIEIRDCHAHRQVSIVCFSVSCSKNATVCIQQCVGKVMLSASATDPSAAPVHLLVAAPLSHHFAAAATAELFHRNPSLPCTPPSEYRLLLCQLQQKCDCMRPTTRRKVMLSASATDPSAAPAYPLLSAHLSAHSACEECGHANHKMSKHHRKHLGANHASTDAGSFSFFNFQYKERLLLRSACCDGISPCSATKLL